MRFRIIASLVRSSLFVLPLVSCAGTPTKGQLFEGNGIQVRTFTLGKNSIQYVVSSGKAVKFKGIACETDGDSEVIETPEGDALQATQYLKKGACWVSIAIAEDHKFLRMEQKGCSISIPKSSFLIRSSDRVR
jgi:hypothetical protein